MQLDRFAFLGYRVPQLLPRAWIRVPAIWYDSIIHEQHWIDLRTTNDCCNNVHFVLIKYHLFAFGREEFQIHHLWGALISSRPSLQVSDPCLWHPSWSLLPRKSDLFGWAFVLPQLLTGFRHVLGLQFRIDWLKYLPRARPDFQRTLAFFFRCQS